MCCKVIYLSLVFLLGFAAFVKGSCLEYGHSCWGAHGKRSGGNIYRSIGGGDIQQSGEKLDASLPQEKVKPNDLLNILLHGNVRISPDDVTDQRDISINSENQNVFDAPEHQLRTKIKSEHRRNSIIHYLPEPNEYPAPHNAIGNPVKRQQNPPAGSSRDYYQVENYPQSDADLEYLNQK